MDIPNSLITVRCHNGLGYGPMIYPAYLAPVLRKVFTGRLDTTAPGNGINVEPFPDNGEQALRYRDVASPEQELGWMRKVYNGANGTYFADAVWTVDTLKKEMEKLLMAEHARLKTGAKPKVLVAAHPTLLAAGLTEEQARALQVAGFPDRASCIDASIVDLASVPTITIELAGRLAAPDAKAEAKK